MWGHVAHPCMGAGTPLRPRGVWALPQCWAHLAYTWRLDSSLWVDTPQRTRGAWAVCLGDGHTPSPHVVLGHAKAQLFLDLVCCRTQDSLRSLIVHGPNRLGSCMWRT